jgi:hypothetical protein
MANTRELSQLASLINVNDETKSIRVLVDQPDAKIGVGTENPGAKVDISGDVNVSGVITATSFIGDGSNLTGISAGIGSENSINTTGIITASSFYGDGSNLSNIVSGVGIQSAGVFVGTGVTTLNFVGAGNTFSLNGTTVNISIAGGGSQVSIGTEAPEDPNEGDLWYSSVLGRTFIYYEDEDSAQWVDASPFNIPEPEIELIPAKTSGTFTATEEQTVFNYTYKPGFIDVFLNGIRLNSTEFIADNGTSITLITPASANDVLDVVEYTMGIGTPGATGAPGAGGPIDNITQTTTDGTFYPIITTGIGTTLPFITTTNNYFEFNPSSGTLTTNQLNIVGIITASAFFGDGSGLTGVGIGSTGSIDTVGIITASAFFGDGSGLSGVSAGSTVTDDTSTDETFFPLLTQQTSGTVTASKVSTTKLTFNPSTGTLNATELNSTSDINLKENIRPIENPLDKVLQINGVEFDWKESKQSSLGVIAQEIEKVFPSLVKTAENKSVNYNGLIGVLIEAVKEQQEQINTLKEEIRLLKEK